MNTLQPIHTSSLNDACILAVEALDNLVTELVKAHYPSPLPGFFDWIADVLTPFVDVMVTSIFYESRFKKSLEMGHPKIAMSLWVYHWVTPIISSKYPALTANLEKLPLPANRSLHDQQAIAGTLMSRPKKLTAAFRTAGSSIYFGAQANMRPA